MTDSSVCGEDAPSKRVREGRVKNRWFQGSAPKTSEELHTVIPARAGKLWELCGETPRGLPGGALGAEMEQQDWAGDRLPG